MDYKIMTLSFLLLTIFIQKASRVNSSQESLENSVMMKWISTEMVVRKASLNLIKMLLPSAFEMAITSNMSKQCTRSLAQYSNGLMNMKAWAVKILDSSTKFSSGILSGTGTFLGDYDKCIETEAPHHSFKGKYCTLQASLPLPKRETFEPAENEIPLIHNLLEPDTVTNSIAGYGGYLYLTPLRFALCIPSTCTVNDVNLIIANALVDQRGRAEMVVQSCETIDGVTPYSLGDISIIILFCVLVALAIIGTVIDIYTRMKSDEKILLQNQSIVHKCLICFSAYANFQRLMSKDNNPESIKMFHGFRLLSILWVIMGHSYFPVNYYAFENLLQGKDMGRECFFQLVINGFLSVDNFFFMSSVLLTYILLRVRGKINILAIFLKRYYRLTPPMMLVVAFYCISERFGSGPLWKEIVSSGLSKNCRERGWMNLLYINNIFYSSKVCLGWTWYLSTDTQLFLIALIILKVLKEKPSQGFLVIGVTMIVSTLISAFCHIYYNLPPVYLQSYLNFADWYVYGAKGYVQIQYHLPVTCIGIIVGYILVNKRGQIPKGINAMGWILSIVLFFLMNAISWYWNQGIIPGPFISAIYGSTYRTIYGLILAFITLSCVWGQGGVANDFLSWEGFVPFSRLTYMVYLVHYGLIYFYTGSLRYIITYDHRNLAFIYSNTIMCSFICAFFLSLVFESPFTALDSLFSGGKRKKQIIPLSTVQEVNMKVKGAA